MTENQIKYLAYQESQRHNAAMERQAAEELEETERANSAGIYRDMMDLERRALDSEIKLLDLDERTANNSARLQLDILKFAAGPLGQLVQ